MSIENLSNSDAKKKLKKLVEDIDFAMLGTNLTKLPISAIPMSTKEVDESGEIWFLSNRTSEHNANIKADSKVQLFYSDPSDMEFISIYGTAEIILDKARLQELYGKSDDAWFDGKDDPNLTGIKVTPKEAFYWDTKSNKYVSLLKMGVAAITGEKADVGERGKLNL